MKGLTRITPALLIVLATATSAFASGSGGYTESQYWNMLWRVLNFVIFGFILYKFAGKHIANLFSGRRKDIETQLTDLAARKDEAEKKLADVEKSIANIEQEREQIIIDAKAQGEALKTAIIEKAHASAEKIKEQATLTAANERQASLQEIRAEVAEMVVEAAEKLLTEKLTADEHDKLINDYLTKVVLN